MNTIAFYHCLFTVLTLVSSFTTVVFYYCCLLLLLIFVVVFWCMFLSHNLLLLLTVLNTSSSCETWCVSCSRSKSDRVPRGEQMITLVIVPTTFLNESDHCLIRGLGVCWCVDGTRTRELPTSHVCSAVCDLIDVFWTWIPDELLLLP